MLCTIVAFLFSSCNILSDIENLKSLESLGTNTTVEEAMSDITSINYAITEAKRMVSKHDDTKYAEKVYEDCVSYEDVINKNDLQEKAKNKMIGGVTYRLYWDTHLHYPFWSTDGVDDIRNSDESTQLFQHESSIEMTNKTNINQCK